MVLKSSADKNTAPKISVIVPIYNAEKYLRRCLDSIRAQTFTNFECICVDDGSPDGSGKILDEYAKLDGRFRVIHQENAGVSAARNVGLAAVFSDGGYIVFVDSDDWISPDMLESIDIETRKTRLSFDMLMFDAWFSDGSEHDAQFKPSATQVFTFTPEKPVPFCGYVWNKAFRTDFLREHSISFPEGIQWGEDGYFAVHAYVEAEKILWIPKKLYNYNTGNITSLTKTDERLKKRWDDNLSVLQGLLEYVERKGMSLPLQETLRRFKCCSKTTYFHSYGTKCDFEFWRNLFPEENAHFYDCKGCSALFYRSVLKRLDWLALLLIWAKSVLRNINYKLRGKRKSATQGGAQ